MKRMTAVLGRGTGLAIATLLLASSVLASSAPAGRIKTTEGAAGIERDGRRLPALIGEAVYVTDHLVTGPDGALGVTLTDGTLIALGANSRLAVHEYRFDADTGEGASVVGFLKGAFRYVSGQLARLAPDKVRVTTPIATIGVRGTDFVVAVDGETCPPPEPQSP